MRAWSMHVKLAPWWEAVEALGTGGSSPKWHHFTISPSPHTRIDRRWGDGEIPPAKLLVRDWDSSFHALMASLLRLSSCV